MRCSIRPTAHADFAGTQGSQNWMADLLEGKHGSVGFEDRAVQQGGPRQHDRTAVSPAGITSRDSTSRRRRDGQVRSGIERKHDRALKPCDAMLEMKFVKTSTVILS